MEVTSKDACIIDKSSWEEENNCQEDHIKKNHKNDDHRECQMILNENENDLTTILGK